MNKNLNLCELLKGHEGKEFYSPAFGKLTLGFINNFNKTILLQPHDKHCSYTFNSDGSYSLEGECILFPSKDQRDWNKWAEEQRAKFPKTWNDLCIKSASYKLKLEIDWRGNIKPYEKAAFALVKMNILIDELYGGIPTKEERFTPNNPIYIITYVDNQLQPIKVYYNIEPIAFHTEEQCLEFLSYPENVQLLKDFYMI